MRINLTKKDIVNSIYMQIGFSKKISENLLEDVLQIILKNIITNKKVKIAKFGTFTLKKKNQRIGRNPKTKEQKIITERNVILFKPSNTLKKIINNNDVYCKVGNKDRYGRLIAICHANDINLNSTMVNEGWAIAYRYYSDDYINEEESAKKNNRGIWEGAFLEPYIWRKNN